MLAWKCPIIALFIAGSLLAGAGESTPCHSDLFSYFPLLKQRFDAGIETAANLVWLNASFLWWDSLPGSLHISAQNTQRKRSLEQHKLLVTVAMNQHTASVTLEHSNEFAKDGEK